MPKNKRPKKNESSSDSDSGPEDVSPQRKSYSLRVVLLLFSTGLSNALLSLLQRGPAEKKLATSSSSSKLKKNDDGEISFALDKSKFVKVREFRGKILIDIREFYEKDGELRPGKKGMPFSLFMNFQRSNIVSLLTISSPLSRYCIECR